MIIEFYLRFRTQYGQQISVTINTILKNGSVDTQVLPLRFYNADFWWATLGLEHTLSKNVQYQYTLHSESGEAIMEAEKERKIEIENTKQTNIILIDTWNPKGQVENTFYTTPFKNVFFSKTKKNFNKHYKTYTHIFKVKAPLLTKDETICITGSAEALGNWNTHEPFLMERVGDWFTAKVNIAYSDSPISYKYGVFDFHAKFFVRFEKGDNRTITAQEGQNTLTIIHDDFVHLPNNSWGGAGVAIPVFSLKTTTSFGTGEFTDLKLLVDWAVETGLKMIQILPVNDTSATMTNQDSYPYAAISAFALHPLYINIHKVAGKKYASHIKTVSKKQRQLNALPELDYAQVISFKMKLVREIYDLQGEYFLKEKEYQLFFVENKHWLKPYAAFCACRDKYGTVDFSKWKTHALYSETEVDKLSLSKSRWVKDIRFYYFIQYQLHLQLTEVADYAHKKGIALKGDIPIGIYRYSVDAWTAPQLYNMDWQAGAPPDDFAIKGQNWGFPTYNWQKMEGSGFDWWKKRFSQMSNYFDAFRIDHILGFFRIWSIPIHAVEGILGRFVPAIPITKDDFRNRGILFDRNRYCTPFITEEFLLEKFGTDTDSVKENFLNQNEQGIYGLKNEFSTQQKVLDHFNSIEHSKENESIKKGLFDLISNVILIEEGEEQNRFHFRISIEQTYSFHQLDQQSKDKLKVLYVEYFYHRQDVFWKNEAMKKLPFLKEATDMQICGEDLGMVPHCVPEVMQNLGILSLEIQRMPKNPNTAFFNPKDAPYLSVITPSSHDMSTIRGWWEENRNNTQKFYNTILDFAGEAPYFCEPWINRAIILQHLYSPAMWSIFQLQDILGMSDILRRENPYEERINQPADPNHYWKYRMHLRLESLIKETGFNTELKDYIMNSGRGY